MKKRKKIAILAVTVTTTYMGSENVAGDLDHILDNSASSPDHVGQDDDSEYVGPVLDCL